MHYSLTSICLSMYTHNTYEAEMQNKELTTIITLYPYWYNNDTTVFIE